MGIRVAKLYTLILNCNDKILYPLFHFLQPWGEKSVGQRIAC